ncbi:hypothetical protein BC829DRAFT_383296, partial [Chytridium lagenaria]
MSRCKTQWKTCPIHRRDGICEWDVDAIRVGVSDGEVASLHHLRPPTLWSCSHRSLQPQIHLQLHNLRSRSPHLHIPQQHPTPTTHHLCHKPPRVP